MIRIILFYFLPLVFSLNVQAIIDTKVMDVSQPITVPFMGSMATFDCPQFKTEIGNNTYCERNVLLVEKQDLELERERVDQTFMTLSEQLPQEIFTNPTYLEKLRNIIREEFIKLNNENKGSAK